MESMVAEFKIDWARAIEDAAIEYADAYTELQCDADNDHQRDHREALKNLRETIKRGLEVAAAQQPAAQPEPAPTSVSLSKRAKLEADGYVVNGVALMHPETRQRVLLDYCGFVGWYGPIRLYGPIPKDEK